MCGIHLLDRTTPNESSKVDKKMKRNLYLRESREKLQTSEMKCDWWRHLRGTFVPQSDFRDERKRERKILTDADRPGPLNQHSSLPTLITYRSLILDICSRFVWPLC